MDAPAFRRQILERAQAAGVPVASATAEKAHEYLALLARWNSKINLTSLPLRPASPDAIDRLIIEPVRVAQALADEPLLWFDLGSGGGSPAIPIKICRPQLRLTMIESKARKAAFLREAVRALNLPSVTVENVRFEELALRPQLHAAVDLITARAVRIDAPFLGLCRALLANGGRLVLIGGVPLPASSGFSPTGTPSFYERST